MSQDLIYLDNASTTPVDPEVKDAMLPWLGEKFGNPSSLHSLGREAKVMIEDTRDMIAEFLKIRPSELFFTSGGTESNNFALIGTAMSFLGKKKKIISSPVEHSSVLETLKFLNKKYGFEIIYTGVTKSGEAVIDKNQTDEDVCIICIMHVNNELGTVSNIRSVRENVPENILIHSDCVQSLGKIELNLSELGCSTASFSAHKIYGPKGIGAIYVKKNTPLETFI
ncbi:MAG: aminotransferase class V-fold PLP-dependent enzyme, partial [Ignavibacteria bacterium]|nr:aminotransferase class V-fold PLP-dependent enzyme [Ignavibacteria bacterium]